MSIQSSVAIMLLASKVIDPNSSTGEVLKLPLTALKPLGLEWIKQHVIYAHFWKKQTGKLPPW